MWKAGHTQKPDHAHLDDAPVGATALVASPRAFLIMTRIEAVPTYR